MTLGYYALTEITLDTDYVLYYGPTPAPSTVTSDGHFRLHIFPDNVTTIQVISKDFAGIDIDREAVYSIKEALAIGFVQPMVLMVDEKSGMGSFQNTPGKEIKPFKKIKKAKHSKSKDVKNP